MFGIHDFPLFLLSGILLNVTPGQDTLYILGRSLAHGRRIGLASAFGILAGAVVHMLSAAFGLSAILAASTTAFAVIKSLGAAYLVYLGIRMLIAKQSPALPAAPGRTVNAWPAFRQGMLTDLLNPKVALFFLAFMPQFIEPGSSNRVLAFLVLGFTFLATGTLWCVIIALFAGRLRNRLGGSGNISPALNRTAGGIFILLGLKLAASK